MLGWTSFTSSLRGSHICAVAQCTVPVQGPVAVNAQERVEPPDVLSSVAEQPGWSKTQKRSPTLARAGERRGMARCQAVEGIPSELWHHL